MRRSVFRAPPSIPPLSGEREAFGLGDQPLQQRHREVEKVLRVYLRQAPRVSAVVSVLVDAPSEFAEIVRLLSGVED